MISHVTPGFRKRFDDLPEDVQQLARKAYRLFQQDPDHPGLRFKQVHPTEPIYSARVSRDYRVIGVLEGNEITWFWIGSHADYDKLLNQIR